VSVFYLTRPGIEPLTFRTWSERYTTRSPRWLSYIEISSFTFNWISKCQFQICCMVFYL